MALVSEKDTAISINERQAERPSELNVHLKTDFDQKLYEDTVSVEGVKYLSAELLIVLGLAQNNPSLGDVVAILVVQRNKLNWNKLESMCSAYGTTRYLGFLLELLNVESSKNLFDPKRIKKIAAGADFGQSWISRPIGNLSLRKKPILSFPQSGTWFHTSSPLLSKIVTDLVRYQNE